MTIELRPLVLFLVFSLAPLTSSFISTSLKSRCQGSKLLNHNRSIARHCIKIESLSHEEIKSRISKVKHSVANSIPFDDSEIDSALQSLRNVAGNHVNELNIQAIKSFLIENAHKTHKRWDETANMAIRLQKILLPTSDNDEEQDHHHEQRQHHQELLDQMFQHVLQGGNWEGASQHALKSSGKPWVVLITGVNGIRKTTSLYQSWFPKVLRTALIHHCGSEQVATLEQERELPNGSNSFFRQLDYMVATVSNEEFQALYRIEDTALYAKLKDAIFSRYRTFAEIIGLLLVRFGVYSSTSFY